jgi:hypothetical protein
VPESKGIKAKGNGVSLKLYRDPGVYQASPLGMPAVIVGPTGDRAAATAACLLCLRLFLSDCRLKVRARKSASSGEGDGCATTTQAAIGSLRVDCADSWSRTWANDLT